MTRHITARDMPEGLRGRVTVLLDGEDVTALFFHPEENPLVSAVSIDFVPPPERPAPRHAWTFEIEVEAEQRERMAEYMRSGQPFSVGRLPAYVRGERWDRERRLFQIEVRA